MKLQLNKLWSKVSGINNYLLSSAKESITNDAYLTWLNEKSLELETTNNDNDESELRFYKDITIKFDTPNTFN